MYTDHSKTSEIRYTQPVLSGEGEVVIYDPNIWVPIIDKDHPSYHDMFNQFSIRKYCFPRFPIDMGKVSLPEENVPNVLRLPIKMAGEEVKIPKEIMAWKPLIDRILQYEVVINRQYEKFFVHVTIDTSYVNVGEYHRFPGYHGDGLQGAKFPVKLTCEHSYIVVTDPPTEVCLQPFFLDHLDPAKHNLFTEMDKQALPENTYKLLSNHLYLFDPYVVHRTPKINSPINRTFFRLTVTPAELMVPKNTINPMFKPPIYPAKIDVRDILAEDSDILVPYELYGLRTT